MSLDETWEDDKSKIPQIFDANNKWVCRFASLSSINDICNKFPEYKKIN